MKKIFFIISIFMTHGLLFAQNWEWAKEDGTSSMYNVGTAICIDGTGNAYFTGSYGSSITFNGCGSYSGNGQRALFTAKYDANGNCLWVVNGQSNSANVNEGLGITVDKHGNVLETGVFSGDMYFDTIRVLDSANIGAMYVVKFNSNGKALWVRTCAYAQGNAISTDGIGNVYVVGEGYFDTLSHCPATGANGWIIKLDSNGNCIWGKSFPKNNVWINAIKADSIGNTFICGGDTAMAIMGNDTLHGGTTGESFIAKLDSSGNFLWAKGPSWDTNANGPYSIGIDKWDNSYMVGVSYGKIVFSQDTLSLNSNSAYVVKYDSNGHFVRDKAVNNGAADAISVSPNGINYVSGSYNSTVSLGGFSVSGGPGIFIAAFDSAGNCLGMQSALGSIYSSSVAGDKNGECYTTGSVYNNSTFGSINLPVTVGNESVFIAKTNRLTSTGTGLRQISETFNVYPNPSAGGYTMQVSSDLLNSTMFIYDINGKLIFQDKIIQQQSQIEIPSLSNGMYLIKLNTPNGATLQKTIVKQ